MLNFCIFVFIIYAVASSVRIILFGYGRKGSRRATAPNSERSSAKKSNHIIRLSRYQRTSQNRHKGMKHAA